SASSSLPRASRSPWRARSSNCAGPRESSFIAVPRMNSQRGDELEEDLGDGRERSEPWVLSRAGRQVSIPSLFQRDVRGGNETSRPGGAGETVTTVPRLRG